MTDDPTEAGGLRRWFHRGVGRGGENDPLQTIRLFRKIGCEADAHLAAQALKDGYNCIVDFDGIPTDDADRVAGYLRGVSFGLDSYHQQLSAHVHLFVPPGGEIDVEPAEPAGRW